ncbi:MAG TPA: ROK family transcriptional regulator [Stellaceae bacterium]|nr:ROK family transcriptional regulator [Stellaceae bacterium]
MVVETMRIHGGLSRAEIARLTALSPQTVSNIANDLLEAGLLTANDPVRGGRGQPATPLSINPEGGFSIGLQLDHRALVGVVVDLSGKVRARIETAVDRPTPDEALPLIRHLVDALRQTDGIDPRRILGCGLAMPGPFGPGSTNAFATDTLPGWQAPSIVGRLADSLGLQVLLENDANAAAIGERLYGVARMLQSFVYLFVGIGLGAGIFLDGRLYRGASDNAGEIGHMIVVPDGQRCSCSNRGCLERYFSLRSAYEALSITDLDQATPSLLLEEDGQNARLVADWLDEAVAPMRRAVNVLEAVLDPDAVIIGGLLPTPLIERLVAKLAPLPASVGALSRNGAPRVLIGQAGHDTAVLGAAAMPIFDEFNPQFDVLLKSP